MYKLGLTERIFYEYVRVFPFWYLRLNLLLMFLKSKLSEVIRAEAETCFLEIMKINILMLLLFVMIINNLVLTKVAIIQNIILMIISIYH